MRYDSFTQTKVTHYDPIDDAMTVRIGTHELQIGGRDGDGFCYGHQSFDCIDDLTREWDEIYAAPLPEVQR